MPLALGLVQTWPVPLAGTMPTEPLPTTWTVRVLGTGIGFLLNVAITLTALFMVTVHVEVLLQPPPLQAVNVEPAAAVAVKVIVGELEP